MGLYIYMGLYFGWYTIHHIVPYIVPRCCFQLFLHSFIGTWMIDLSRDWREHVPAETSKFSPSKPSFFPVNDVNVPPETMVFHVKYRFFFPRFFPANDENFFPSTNPRFLLDRCGDFLGPSKWALHWSWCHCSHLSRETSVAMSPPLDGWYLAPIVTLGMVEQLGLTTWCLKIAWKSSESDWSKKAGVPFWSLRRPWGRRL